MTSLLWVSAFSVGLMASSALGGDVQLPMGDHFVTKRVKSLLELRQQNVVMQELDHSCGAAALATVLRHRFEEPVTESEVIGFIFIFGQTPEKGIKKYFKRRGFTLLDLKRAARARGYQSVGYKNMNLEELAEFLYKQRVPVMVPINPMGYNHFVVVKGLSGDRVLLADPAFGNTKMSIGRFMELWIDGIGFIIKPKSMASKPDPYPHLVVADRELEDISAAGDGSPDAGSPLMPPSTTLVSSPDPIPSTESWQFQPFMQMSVPGNLLDMPHELPQMSPTFRNDFGRNLITRFNVENFTGGLQLGNPQGNFVDFSPGPGRDITSDFSGN